MQESTPPNVVTVIEVTYIATKEGGQPEHIGLWYRDGGQARLLLFSLQRTDLLCLAGGDKGTLTQNGDKWEFTPRGN